MVIIMDQLIVLSLYGKCIVKEGWREMRREKEGEKRKRKTREKKNERIYRTYLHSYSSHPPLLIISLDGFRADYLDRDLTPNIQSFASDGVQAAYMTPAYPSLTFPNHFTIVTVTKATLTTPIN